MVAKCFNQFTSESVKHLHMSQHDYYETWEHYISAHTAVEKKIFVHAYSWEHDKSHSTSWDVWLHETERFYLDFANVYRNNYALSGIYKQLGVFSSL